jgi:hypothetical protein
MTHEEHRQLEFLPAAEANPKLRTHYSFSIDPELAATAVRLGMVPVPQMIDVSERLMPGGPAVYLVGIHDSERRA